MQEEIFPRTNFFAERGGSDLARGRRKMAIRARRDAPESPMNWA